ncbi:MAG: hypothetical protein NTZ38_02830 [Candidatus Taylorbacteria bacterium]|nr:hypothetical protein [Candidatus Taylorbacteria bacterium]
MNDLSQYLKVHEERIHAMLEYLVLQMMLALSNDPRNSKASAKTTQTALRWFSDNSSSLTSPELNILYSLLRRTGTTKKTYARATEISALSSRLYDIDLEKNGGISPSPNFKSVELFISTLSSGDYQKVSLKKSDLPDWLRDSGNMDLFTSK